MRVKVGDQWFEPAEGQPVMVELTKQDKMNIANMVPEATRYALFDDADDRTVKDKLAWMDDGATI